MTCSLCPRPGTLQIEDGPTLCFACFGKCLGPADTFTLNLPARLASLGEITARFLREAERNAACRS